VANDKDVKRLIRFRPGLWEKLETLASRYTPKTTRAEFLYEAMEIGTRILDKDMPNVETVGGKTKTGGVTEKEKLAEMADLIGEILRQAAIHEDEGLVDVANMVFRDRGTSLEACPDTELLIRVDVK